MLKIDVFAPIPNASVRMIMRVKPGLFRMMRKAYRISLNSISMIPPNESSSQIGHFVRISVSTFTALQMGASLLLLGGRRQHTVQAQIHCGFGVVVGPSTGQDQAQPGACNLFSAESFRGLR